MVSGCIRAAAIGVPRLAQTAARCRSAIRRWLKRLSSGVGTDPASDRAHRPRCHSFAKEKPMNKNFVPIVSLYVGLTCAPGFGADIAVEGGTASFVVATSVPAISVKG